MALSRILVDFIRIFTSFKFLQVYTTGQALTHLLMQYTLFGEILKLKDNYFFDKFPLGGETASFLRSEETGYFF